MGAPHRRTIYIASLEAHVDRLHAQMISIGFFPVDFEKLEPFKGLNSKTAKASSEGNAENPLADDEQPPQSMVAGLQHDASHIKLKLLELERSASRFFHPFASSLKLMTFLERVSSQSARRYTASADGRNAATLP
jgi:hypothetical protein